MVLVLATRACAGNSNRPSDVEFRRLPHRHAGNSHPRAEDEVVAGHVERAPVVIPPGQIRGMAGNTQPSDEFAVRVHDMDAAGAGAVDIALLVALHAVGDAGFGTDERMKDAAVAHAAVGIDVEGADEAEPRIVDIEDRFGPGRAPLARTYSGLDHGAYL